MKKLNNSDCETSNILSHKKALPNHYDVSAKSYDQLNEENSLLMNNTVNNFLKMYSPDCKSILDVTCGTGSQVFYLKQIGYDVTGSDINVKMLEIAKNKALTHYPDLLRKFHHADMCSVRLGKFDAVISMFNAIGHLTKEDFERAILNTRFNLTENGIYIFDIFNASYLRHDNNISKLTIDWITKESNEVVVRKIQYSDIDEDGILRSYSILYESSGKNHFMVSKKEQTLQVYTSEELVELLNKCGFNILKISGINGTKFSEIETERIFITAQIKL